MIYIFVRFPYKILLLKNKNVSIKNQKGFAVWFTGLSGAGKTTLAENLQKKLSDNGYITKVLDGDNLRNGINAGLGFNEEDRLENIRRAAEVAKLFIDSNIITICSFITPTEKMRECAKKIIGESNYVEIFVDCSIEICEKRDVKGLYKKVRAGEIKDFTGINSSYETPIHPKIIINTEQTDINHCIDQIHQSLTTFFPPYNL